MDSFRIDKKELSKHVAKHHVKNLAFISYPAPHVWVLDKVLVYGKPFVYTHRQGAIVWVTL